MDNTGYQRILFKAAILTMGCDGEFHPNEVQEISLAFEDSILFKDLNFHDEFDLVMGDFGQNRKEFLTRYFEEVGGGDLDPVQKLQILEIILRIMHADSRVDANEVRFLRLTKSRLGVADEIFVKRFGQLDIFPIRPIQEKLEDTVGAFVEEVEFPDFTELGTGESQGNPLKRAIGKLLRRGL